ncbi:CaiB/BaiF CoA transferase family protein [Pacificibacter marinus]|uniref:Formyl-coenzyme A transferase n=1 Tax=Pacificibacter marinus TaxID=658057 RepID=A0A1Y5SC31_9RHOB|nr:CoA transferase [Pacificibacter marinus]SEK48053.1 Crotonobetainyl-CoA:carnitine CoA-transferase CaiB [Pacificibacter marinus]SLN36243.1 Formyl-coenzyme A transferase [Pacificibacter marinus]
MSDILPLEGLKVLDFSQFLAGPYCALKLADLGADVVKVERAGMGDLSRYLYLTDTKIAGESTIFHAINRNKRSVAVNLKSDDDKAALRALIAEADVVLQNFRPGVMERLGFGYEAVRAINPKIVYGTVTGYGSDGPWVDLPGQDLLAQARAGVMWLSGGANDGPTPMGLPVADVLAGAALAHGILALLFRRERHGIGGYVETSLIESLADLQFELLTTWFNDGGRTPKRSANNAAHAYLAAPYGVYETADGHIAIAMGKLDILAELTGLASEIATLDTFTQRDEIKAGLAERLQTQGNAAWMEAFVAADIWAAPIMNWQDLMDSGVLETLDMVQEISRGDVKMRTTKLPLRIDGIRPASSTAAPELGDANHILTQGW